VGGQGRGTGGRGKPGGDGTAAGAAGGDVGALGPGRAAAWLEELNSSFPADAAAMVQKDALATPRLQAALLQPESIPDLIPDPRLIADLLALARLVPDRAKQAARALIQRLADDLAARMKDRIERAVRGARDPVARTRRPRPSDIDWGRTVRANISTWTPELGTIVPERLIGRGAGRRRAARRIVLCLDQSHSMAPSIVHASVAACVLASIPALSVAAVAFDTEPVDLTAALTGDPAEVLFGIQLGGGTDIDRALALCETLIDDPERTILAIVSDLEEGGDRASLAARAAQLVSRGTLVVCLLALDSEGAPRFDAAMAAEMEAAGCAVFGCTPELFPEMMAAAIERRDLRAWAAARGLAHRS